MKALYAGSFDPPHLGHLDIIRRASRLFDSVTVAVLGQSEKSYALPLEKRAEMLRRVTGDLPNVEVMSASGLLTDLMAREGCDVVLRGVRTQADMPFELELAQAYQKLGGYETLFLPAECSLSRLSSTIVRDCARHGADLSGMVPEELINDTVRAYGAAASGKGV